MDYQEKLIWGQFLPLTLVFAAYLAALRSTSPHPMSFLAAAVLLALIQVVSLIAIAIFVKKEPRDERDRLIEYKAYKFAYLTLMCVAFFAIVAAALGLAHPAQPTAAPILIALWFAIEILRTGAQLVFRHTGLAA